MSFVDELVTEYEHYEQDDVVYSTYHLENEYCNNPIELRHPKQEEQQ